MDIQNLIQKQLFKDIESKFNEIFIRGLTLKGFYLSNMKEAEEFVKEHCRCEDNFEAEEKIYYVNDIPFLLYMYKRTEIETINDFKKTSITASCGSYAYL